MSLAGASLGRRSTRQPSVPPVGMILLAISKPRSLGTCKSACRVSRE